MALPQNPQGITNTDRLLLDAVNAQTQNLNAQTRVLHNVSDNIMKQNREFSKLRKDVQELSKSFIQGNSSNFAEIKKYFEKSKTQGKDQPRMNASAQRNKSDEERGFFKGLVGKLFGPSKYQQKMMDDTAAILNFNELISADISFIKKQYEDPSRAKERELLAQAIADKINASSGEGGGVGGGLLTAIGGTLLAGIGIALKGVAEFIVKGFGNLIGPTLSLLAKTLDLIGPTFRLITAISAAIAGVLTSLLEWLKTGKTPTEVPKSEPKTPSGSGGNRNQPRLPAPAQLERLLPNAQGVLVPESELPEKANWWDRLKQYGGALGSGIKKFTLPGALGFAGGAAYNYGMPDDIKKEIADFIREQFPGAPLADWLGPEGGNEYNKRQSLKTGRENYEMKQQRIADEQAPLIIPEELKYRIATDPNNINLELMEMTKSLTDNVWNVDGALKQLTDSLFDYEQKIEEATVKVLDFIAPKIDKMTEIDFGNGQTLNLAPGLGTSLAEVLKEVGQETKDLIVDATGGMGDITTNIVNNVAPPKQDSIIAFPSVVAEEQLKMSSGMAAYRFGRLFK